MVRVINAARAGQSVLSFPVYDGSETGDKVFDTLTVIGHEIAPGERNHDDAAAGEAKLASMPRWPVTISYFEHGKSRQKFASKLPLTQSVLSSTPTAFRARWRSTTTILSSTAN